MTTRNERRRLQFEKQKPSDRLGDAPIEQKYHSMMEAVAHGLDEIFNKDLQGNERTTGFVLLVFPFGEVDTGRCNYISNGADRRDVVTLMKEMIARFEGQPETKGRA